MLSKLFAFFQQEKKQTPTKLSVQLKGSTSNDHKSNRKGELGEYKINIQLDQLPKDFISMLDLLIPNKKGRSGYSQIDHVILTPYAVFIIETKNYSGEIVGSKSSRIWRVNNQFDMLNPFFQNYSHIEALKSIIDIKDEQIVSLVSFTRRCTFKVDVDLRKVTQSNHLIVYDTELTEFIHRKINVIKMQSNQPIFSQEDLACMSQRIMVKNVTDPAERAKHVRALKTTSIGSDASELICSECGTKVSERVKSFCLGNPRRFKGKVYCFEHQKNVND